LLLTLTLGSALFAPFSIVLAQGTAFTYQGQLTENGAPANGSYDLTVSLFDAASGGTSVGTSNVFNDLLISNGLLTVTLDFGASAFNGAARWLEIGVRPGQSSDGYASLTPRQRKRHYAQAGRRVTVARYGAVPAGPFRWGDTLDG
jgi:hypothetical protein